MKVRALRRPIQLGASRGVGPDQGADHSPVLGDPPLVVGLEELGADLVVVPHAAMHVQEHNLAVLPATHDAEGPSRAAGDERLNVLDEASTPWGRARAVVGEALAGVGLQRACGLSIGQGLQKERRGAGQQGPLRRRARVSGRQCVEVWHGAPWGWRARADAAPKMVRFDMAGQSATLPPEGHKNPFYAPILTT